MVPSDVPYHTYSYLPYDPEMRGKGLVMPPPHERMEEQARNQPELDAMYKKLSLRSAPASYNALTAGL